MKTEDILKILCSLRDKWIEESEFLSTNSSVEDRYAGDAFLECANELDEKITDLRIN